VAGLMPAASPSLVSRCPRHSVSAVRYAGQVCAVQVAVVLLAAHLVRGESAFRSSGRVGEGTGVVRVRRGGRPRQHRQRCWPELVCLARSVWQLLDVLQDLAAGARAARTLRSGDPGWFARLPWCAATPVAAMSRCYWCRADRDGGRRSPPSRHGWGPRVSRGPHRRFRRGWDRSRDRSRRWPSRRHRYGPRT
jgi:hypothetical protein